MSPASKEDNGISEEQAEIEKTKGSFTKHGNLKSLLRARTGLNSN